MIKRILFGTTKRSAITIVSTLAIVTIGILGVVAYNKQQNDGSVTVYSSSREGSAPKTSTSSSSGVDENDKFYREALATLEESDKPVKDTEKIQAVQKAIQTAQDKVLASDKVVDVTGDYDNKLSMTDSSMVLTFAIICKTNNYRVQKVEVFESKSVDVLQYVITMTNDTGKNCYLAGNYNTYAGLLQIVSYHGGEVGATGG